MKIIAKLKKEYQYKGYTIEKWKIIEDKDSTYLYIRDNIKNKLIDKRCFSLKTAKDIIDILESIKIKYK